MEPQPIRLAGPLPPPWRSDDDRAMPPRQGLWNRKPLHGVSPKRALATVARDQPRCSNVRECGDVPPVQDQAAVNVAAFHQTGATLIPCNRSAPLSAPNCALLLQFQRLRKWRLQRAHRWTVATRPQACSREQRPRRRPAVLRFQKCQHGRVLGDKARARGGDWVGR